MRPVNAAAEWKRHIQAGTKDRETSIITKKSRKN